ncbi:hypothetical protein [Paraburkholderia sp. BL27I4N3]|uniref:hypothetical protein n=1 Tax=Paraburkholderia sp. BL27I4N3 TaxID=1938805 RepID=UPI000E221F0D|nr:hypothetical protein [Paraburkholderia sp. BL27I4N3]
MKTSFLQALLYDVFDKYFDPAFAFIERTEEPCAVEFDAQPASVAADAQVLCAPRRVRARRFATRRCLREGVRFFHFLPGHAA